MSDRPRLTVVADNDHRDGADDAAELRQAADRLLAEMRAQPLAERVAQIREGYRLSYRRAGDDPHLWLGLLTQAVGDAARPLNRSLVSTSDTDRPRRLREAEEFAEQAAACALELADVIRSVRTDPGI